MHPLIWLGLTLIGVGYLAQKGAKKREAESTAAPPAAPAAPATPAPPIDPPGSPQ